jgi:hypothetical protein
MDTLRLFEVAADLVSDGTNPEYDRALVELVANAIGIGTDEGYLAVAIRIGVTGPLMDRW